MLRKVGSAFAAAKIIFFSSLPKRKGGYENIVDHILSNEGSLTCSIQSEDGRRMVRDILKNYEYIEKLGRIRGKHYVVDERFC